MNDDTGLSGPVDAPDDPTPTTGPRRLRRIGRRTLVVTAVAVCVAAGGGAIAAAAGGSGSGGSGAPPAGEGPAGGGTGGPRHGGGPGGPLLGRSIHGTFVVPSSSGGSTTYQTDVQQAGKVTALSGTSITLQSPDGYTATYVIGPSTKKDSTVKQGGQAVVIATGDPATALSVTVPGDRPMRGGGMGRGGMGGGPEGTPPSGAPGGSNGAPGGPAT